MLGGYRAEELPVDRVGGAVEDDAVGRGDGVGGGEVEDCAEDRNGGG